ncbi:MAG: hypothetical protein P4L99_01645 [Chthoniobacter sp.]|nr:hypothetical protein [Chthoniobacter sp.]
MKHLSSLLVLLGCVAFAASAPAANPFLSATDDKPVATKFTGTEWNDEYGVKEFPLSATIVTTRIAHAAWGDIFKVSFEKIGSRLTPKREILPDHFIVTDNEIVLLNEEKPEETAKNLAASPTVPTFEPGDVRGINTGTRKTSDTLTETSIIVKGNRCTYMWSHNSGHFTTIIWQKGVGLIEYAQGRGASADGYRLKRVGVKGL